MGGESLQVAAGSATQGILRHAVALWTVGQQRRRPEIRPVPQPPVTNNNMQRASTCCRRCKACQDFQCPAALALTSLHRLWYSLRRERSRKPVGLNVARSPISPQFLLRSQCRGPHGSFTPVMPAGPEATDLSHRNVQSDALSLLYSLEPAREFSTDAKNRSFTAACTRCTWHHYAYGVG